MTLLVLGGSGHLGREVLRQAQLAGDGPVATYRRAPGAVSGPRWLRVDIRDRPAVRALFDEVRPSTVVNCAYDYREWTVNADGAANVAAESARLAARLVHLSTDVVHSGRTRPYLDDEPPSPPTVYGASKAAAETAVRLVDPRAAIVRTSLILGDADSQQVRLCLDLITGTVAGALFSDEYRCPVGVSDLASAVLELASSDYAGLLNVAGPQAVSRAELGHLIARRFGLPAEAVPVSTIAEAGLVRPAEIRLDITRAQRVLRTRLRPVSELTFDA